MIRDEIYKFFADYIYQNTGMVYAPNEYYRLDTRINDLVRFLSVKDVEEVYQMYKKHITPDMRAILINISTNNETYFFRDVKPFSILTKHILPEILKENPSQIKIWSAASSTGQEIYSILMAIKNTMPADVFLKVQAYASDISTDALSKAKLATYNGLDVQRGLPVALLMKYFEQINPEAWKINSEIQSKVNFFEFNLISGNYPREAYDVIFIRNVLIYQNPENKKVILDKIYTSLKKGGFIVLGTGESLIGIENNFERVSIDGSAVYKK